MAKLAFVMLFVTLVAVGPLAANGYNVLVTVVSLSSSHNLAMYNYGNLLGEYGHSVTMLRSNFDPNAKVPKSPYIKKEIIHEILTKDEAAEVKEHRADMTWNTTKVGVTSILRGLKVFGKIPVGCGRLLDDEGVMKQLRAEKWDAIVIHIVDLCAVGLSHVLGVNSTAMLLPVAMPEMFAWYAGSPYPVSYVPAAFNSATDSMTLRQRAGNLGMYLFMVPFTEFVILPTYSGYFRERYGSSFPHHHDLMRSVQLYFVNSEQLFDIPRPSMPNIVHIAGFNLKPRGVSNLNEEFTAIAESEAANKHGFIIFSLGSVVDTKHMPRERVMAFFKAFRRLPHQFIWRFEGTLKEAENTNVYISKWLPQKDLLNHKNIAGFITHGGYNSIMESAMSGVPLIVMPLFADQYSNAAKVVRAGLGIQADLKTATEDEIYELLQQLLTDKSYSNNARRLSLMIAKKPVSGRDQAVKWLEFLAEFGTLDNLQNSAKYLRLYQYFLLDILAIVALTVSIAIFCCVKSCKICFRLCQTKRKQKTQ